MTGAAVSSPSPVFADQFADVAMLDGRFQLPVERWVRLLAVGGYGAVGVWRAQLGAQLFVDGHGGPGSLAVSVLAGIAGMFERDVCPRGGCGYGLLIAPALGLELEWRP